MIAVEERLKIDRSKEQVAKQYFLQMTLAVATVAFVFFGGSPVIAGAGLLLGLGVLEKTVGLNFRRSPNPYTEYVQIGIGSREPYDLAAFTYVLLQNSV